MLDILLCGFGFMGQTHAAVLRALPGVNLRGVVDPRGENIRDALQEKGVGDLPVFPTLDDALRAQTYDVADICLPTDMHREAVEQALAAGSHVFCEKPIVLARDDADAMIAAAERAGCELMIGHCIRFWPEYQPFEAFVKSGKGGRLLSLSMQRRSARPTYSEGDWLNDETRSGAAALDLHIHDTDFVHHLLGKPEAVTSVGTKNTTGWSHIFTTYHFKDVAVIAEGGWNYPVNWGFQMAFQAIFEKATVEYDSGTLPSLTVTMGKEKKQPLPFQSPGAGESKTGAGNLFALGGYYNDLAEFIRCVESGSAPSGGTTTQRSCYRAVLGRECLQHGCRCA